MLNEETPMIEFTAECRCDRCGARAITLATHPEYGELMFCWHHGGDRSNHRQVLLDEGWMLVDDYEEYEKYLPKTRVPA